MLKISYGIDFKLIKLVIYPILKPLLYMFNLILNKSLSIEYEKNQ